MAKKDTSAGDQQKLDDKAYQDAIEEKVRLMLDPKLKDPKPVEPPTEAAAEATTAPEIETTEPTFESPREIVSESEPVNKPETHDATETLEEEPPEDNATAEAVDEIVAKEGDDLLAHDDAKLAEATDHDKPSFRSRLKDWWSGWWGNPKTKWATIIAAVVIVITAIILPPSRYFLLNTAGVRGSASLIVLDDSTQQPLRNVQVSIGKQTSQTDADGKVKLSHLRLGTNQVVIEKRAFAALNRKLTIGWGSNPLGDFKLQPVGAQYSFVITDYLSGKPLEKVEAVQNDFSAFSDEQGKLKLTLEADQAEKEVEVIIKAEGYRDEKVTLNLDSKTEIALQLVPGRQHVFVSKRSGKYDVYKIDADGKNESVLLAGTGSERSDLVLAPHPTKGIAALVSTRENVRNRDGFLLSTLTIINSTDNTASKIAQSERVQIVDWSGDRLVYVQIAAGASASDPNRHRLMSYSLETGESKELAASNYFNDVFSAGGSIFYAPSSAYTSEKASLFKIAADGSGKQTAFNQEVWNAFRTEYDKLVITAGQDWYDYRISDGKSSRLNGEPANLHSGVYVDSPDHHHSLWVDVRDGKGVLLAYDLDKKEDVQILERSGLSNPVRWLNNSAVVFRIKTDSESADYVMSLDGGEARKLKDVTNTSGVDQWYYY